MLEPKKVPQGISVEGVCFGLRTLLGGRLIQNVNMKIASAFIVLLCDNKSGTNDTIEVTLVSGRREFRRVRIVINFLFSPRLVETKRRRRPSEKLFVF